MPNIDSLLSKWKICVVLPTKNEGSVLQEVVKEIRTAFQQNGLHEPIIIIADDSHDETRSLARKLHLYVIIGGGKGLGYAMCQGLRYALTFKPNVILSMDSDGQSVPGEIRRFLEPIAKNEADMVLSSRFLETGLIQYRYRWRNRLGVMVLTQILRWLTKLPLTDSHGGIRAMRTEVVRELDIIGTHTYVQEAIIDAHEKGFRIKEVPSVWRKRSHGSSQVVGSIPKYIMYTLPTLIVRSGAHVRWLYSAGALLIGSAFVFFCIISWEAGFRFKVMFDRLPSFVLIGLLVTVGFQLFTFGFLAELIKNVKYRVDRLDSVRPGVLARPRDSTHVYPQERFQAHEEETLTSVRGT